MPDVPPVVSVLANAGTTLTITIEQTRRSNTGSERDIRKPSHVVFVEVRQYTRFRHIDTRMNQGAMITIYLNLQRNVYVSVNRHPVSQSVERYYSSLV